ncbi:MAG: hypothetical protein IKR73_01490 [Oscillospiraceae bacterium]|nr:hypothetical protein [Oscillospiraceae bacterium]
MKTEKKYFSVQKKLYIFIFLTVPAAAPGSSMIAYITSADQIDRYYRQSASDDATVELVFKRADKAMYADKQRFKQEHGSYR